MPIETVQSALAQGAKTLGLDLTTAQLALLEQYLQLLQKWNKVYNLTALRDAQDMLTHHVLDSLAAVPPLMRHLGQQPDMADGVLDVGSGGGLPGVVLAIVLPHVKVSCVDAVAKKAAFVQQVAAQLGLANLTGLHARVETLVGRQWGLITSRAFASLKDFVTLTHELLAPEGVWMAMKGRHPADEMASLPAWANVFHVEQLQVPALQAERCIVWMRRQ
ncbi:16S rRNA (guanine(527)-N(7))-methyltransferase RsmG [Curvibacter sp. CHRR-16]|uniref:16S rRNA (guanine(527)-N(7))-methyltransferase RsmG n=1 Tax=Curvibacter sp. CHRR-16 TaxID=2835872 RepID=UPI001BD99729|nr:16S rRNA (guanine(527)-N(7))-methyltransferase RsmG [Curvibacter sp. CHRR-16]MBT0570261.1 16S rRNA (guanine(527)-N(7))-methyltransferase RsmG [Curvibacter sp. CHRR-16]